MIAHRQSIATQHRQSIPRQPVAPAALAPVELDPVDLHAEDPEFPDGPDDPTPADAVEVAHPVADEVTVSLLSQMRYDPDPARRREARDTLVEHQRPFADFLARRFRNRGEPLEDLRQVAAVGLIKAIDGFDLERGTSFAAYAIPTILGELRRHFRDKGWSIRVPRRLQELRADIAAATEQLSQELGRNPTAADLAEALGRTEEEISEGLKAAQAYSGTSLQAPLRQDGDQATLGDLVAQDENGYEVVEARESLRTAIHSLPERQRRILGLRFYHQLTQVEIAAELGISQMHVSRLLSRSLDRMREQLQLAS